MNRNRQRELPARRIHQDVPIRQPRLREIASDAAIFRKATDEGDLIQCNPPDWCIKEIEARGQWEGIPRLEGITESPTLARQWNNLQTPGYDPQTGLIFKPQQVFPTIAERVTLDDAKRACDQLLEVVADFPFQNATHRASWLAGVLTPLARFAIDGPSPLFVIDANVRSCGKTLLADVIGIITSGRPMPRMTMSRDDEELRKRITAIALSGERQILLDDTWKLWKPKHGRVIDRNELDRSDLGGLRNGIQHTTDGNVVRDGKQYFTTSRHR